MRRVWQQLKIGISLGLLLLAPQMIAAQEAERGVAMPFSISGLGLRTQRLQTEDPNAAGAAAAFRAMFYPSVKLGSHWFGYAAIQVRSTPYYFQEAYSSERSLQANLLQGFMGYAHSANSKSLVIKAGQLSSAFGSFLPRYDDAVNPMIDWPLSYGYYREPVSFTGVMGLEIDASIQRLDTRFQLTNSSPVNPQGLLSRDQHAQWAAGAGYTILQGFRVGVSAYRGPYMRQTSRYLEGIERSADYSATGLGLDAQWARGRWSLNGEWQHFELPYPRMRTVIGNYGYAEAKAVLTPRWYAAVRAGYQDYNYRRPDRQSYDFVFGYRPNRFQLIKVGYQWLRDRELPGTRDDVWAVQYVTSIDSLHKSFR